MASADPPPAKKTKRSPLPPCATWLELETYVIGTVSTFLDVGSDLQSLVVAAGREHTSVIKRAYLTQNFRFLRSCVLWKSQYKLRQWMEVNNDWRSMYSEGTLLRRSIVGEQYDVSVPIAPEGHVIRLGNFLGGLTFLGYPKLPDEIKGPCEESKLARNVGDLIVAVDRQSVVCKSILQVRRLMLEGRSRGNDSVCLRFVEIADYAFTHCFCDPETAIDLGLFEVLRFLVEEKKVDVNSQDRSGTPLLAQAVIHPDPSMFEYLLTVEAIDCNCVVPGEGTILHIAADRRVEVSRFESLLGQEGVDINSRNASGQSVLHSLALEAALFPGDAEAIVGKAKLILEAGADPNVRNNRDWTALDLARQAWLIGSSSASGLDEIIALLEKAASDDGH